MAQEPEDDFVVEEEGAERTAIVNLAELRAEPRPSTRDRHLLIRVHGSQLGQVLTLTDDEYLIGRSQDSDLWLTDPGMSRRHARIIRDGEEYVLEDLDSANGTFIEGERIKRHRLRHGDTMQLGPTIMLRYSLTDADEEAVLRRLYEASVRDALTGAYNREHFDERLTAESSYARRHGSSLALVMFDLDHFKRVNDTFGHQAGDAVLVGIAQNVRQGLRAEDVFVRYGGEEFSVILRGIDLLGAAHVGERLRQGVAAAPVSFDGRDIGVTISVGCASLTCCQEQDPEELIAIADRRLYIAKRTGRNRVVAEG
jgi:diguanylate cyclase (GGDEF)-like protein